MSPEEMKRIAYHEAGHAIIGVHEGFPPAIIEVHREGASVRTSYEMLSGSTMAFVSSRLRLLLGGAVAQCLILKPDIPYCRKDAYGRIDAKSDWEKARELIGVLLHHENTGRNAEPGMLLRKANDIEERHAAEARAILEANKNLLQRIAELVIIGFTELNLVEAPLPGGPRLVVNPIEVEAALEDVVSVPHPTCSIK